VFVISGDSDSIFFMQKYIDVVI